MFCIQNSVRPYYFIPPDRPYNLFVLEYYYSNCLFVVVSAVERDIMDTHLYSYTNSNAFTDKLRYLREQAHMTQGEVARSLHCTRQAYSNYERGTRMPDLNSVQELAELFSVSLDYLLRDDMDLPDLPPDEENLTH